MSFTRMSNAVAHLLPKMYEHPFNQALFRGTLPKHTFRFYLEQDALYLKDFAQALHAASRRFDNKLHAQEFERLAEKMVASERKMQKQYLGEFHSSGLFAKKRKIEKVPILNEYINHLFQAVHFQSLEEAVASLVPCFWIYNQLGQQVNAHQNNPYQRWIASYSSEQFSTSVKSIVGISDALGENIKCKNQKEKMIEAFIKSTEYEIKFLDSVNAMHEKECRLEI